MLRVEIHGTAAHVVLDRPEVHNAFNDALIAQLADAFGKLSDRTDIRAVVLRGSGKSFSAGADLNWMKQAAAYTPEENLRDAKRAAAMFLAVAACPKPVIARVHGAALGGGAGLVAACDIAAAVQSARFGFSEVKLGIIPAIIAPHVIARIGAARAREYFLTGERFSAETAKAIGLVQHVTPDQDALDALIAAKLAEIETASPLAIAAAKSLIFALSPAPIDASADIVSEAIARARTGPDARAGIDAFLNGAKPPWVRS